MKVRDGGRILAGASVRCDEMQCNFSECEHIFVSRREMRCYSMSLLRAVYRAQP